MKIEINTKEIISILKDIEKPSIKVLGLTLLTKKLNHEQLNKIDWFSNALDWEVGFKAIQLWNLAKQRKKHLKATINL